MEENKDAAIAPGGITGIRRNMKAYAIIIVLSALLLLLGDRFIGQAESTDLFGDAMVYTSMAEGDFTNVSAPFKYRLLVPTIAWLLPFSAIVSLKLVSYAGLFLFYVFTLLTCRQLGFGLAASFGGLFAVYSTVWHLYNYQNPYLTDTIALLLLTLLLLSVIRRSFMTYVCAAVLAVLTREITIFFVPMWLVTKEWRRAGTAIIAGVLVLMLPRLMLSSVGGLSSSVVDVINHVDRLGNLLSFARPVLFNWGFVGFLTILGLLFTPNDRTWLFLCAFGLLLLAAVLSSFIATDVGRMFAVMSPIMVISCAQLLTVLSQKNIYVTVLLGTAFVTQLFWVPTIITSREGWVFETVFPRLILGVLELLLIIAIITVLRTDLVLEFKARRAATTRAAHH